MTTDPAPTPSPDPIYLGAPRDPDAGTEALSVVLGIAAILLALLGCLSAVALFFDGGFRSGIAGIGGAYGVGDLTFLQRVQIVGSSISSVGTVALGVAVAAIAMGRGTGRIIGGIAVGFVIINVLLAVLRSQTTFTI